MYDCNVCKRTFDLSNDLQQHMQRHLKSELISAVIKLPTDAPEDSDAPSSSCSHSTQSSCTSDCLSQSEPRPKKKPQGSPLDLGGSDVEELKTPKIIRRAEKEDKNPFDILQELNNNQSEIKKSSGGKKGIKIVRRSCRLKGLTKKIEISKSSSPFSSMEDNYYIPPSCDENANDLTMKNDDKTIKAKSSNTDDSEDDVKLIKRIRPRKKAARHEGRKGVASVTVKEEPVFSTPPLTKEPSSETDSCSASTPTDLSTEIDKCFCSYCGSGYRTQSMLADHVRHNHHNFCTVCAGNFPDVQLYRTHRARHASRVYVCQYCDAEFAARPDAVAHGQRHLSENVLSDVLSLEEDYANERGCMNTMYNMFNAGYAYGRRVTSSVAASGHVQSEFYQVFLQYATPDVERIEHFGYLCRTCGFTLFDPAHYKDHMQIAHGVTANDVEKLLSI